MARMPYPETDATRATHAAHQKAIGEARQAAGAAQALRALVESGGDVEPSALTEATARAEHAALRVEAAHRRMAEARARARTAALQRIAGEIQAYSHGAALSALTKSVDAVQAAVNQMLETCEQHTQRVNDWHERAGALLAEPDPRGFLPASDQAGVAVRAAFGSMSVQCGNLVLGTQMPDQLLAEVVYLLQLDTYHPRVDLAPVKAALEQRVAKSLPPDMAQGSPRTIDAHFRDDE